MKTQLLNTADRWEEMARDRLKRIENPIDDIEKRSGFKNMMKHGATCYLNCAKDIRLLVEHETGDAL